LAEQSTFILTWEKNNGYGNTKSTGVGIMIPSYEQLLYEKLSYEEIKERENKKIEKSSKRFEEKQFEEITYLEKQEQNIIQQTINLFEENKFDCVYKHYSFFIYKDKKIIYNFSLTNLSDHYFHLQKIKELERMLKGEKVVDDENKNNKSRKRS
jgi:hypothetical protein